MNTLCRRLALLLLPLLLVACGGSVGGTVSGLASGDSVTLQNNGKDDLTVTKNGDFEFDTVVPEERGYSVTVSKQPKSSSCEVTSGSGTVAVDVTQINDVVVKCTIESTVVGTVTGLNQGNWLELSNVVGITTQKIEVPKNGAFAFDGILKAGDAYVVTISAQLGSQVCNVTNGSGTAVADKQTDIQIVCQP
jgi:hypothetical protein